MKNFTQKFIGLLSLLFLTSSNLFAQEVLGSCQAEYTPIGYPSWYVAYGSGFYDCDLNCYPYYYIQSGPTTPLDIVASCVVNGCMDPNAFNYNPDADIQNNVECIPKIYGCTDTVANNYDENAPINTSDSTMCEYLGCTDPQSQNYNESANTDDGSCISWAQIVADLQSDLDSMMNNSGITQADLDAAQADATAWENQANEYYNNWMSWEAEANQNYANWMYELDLSQQLNESLISAQNDATAWENQANEYYNNWMSWEAEANQNYANWQSSQDEAHDNWVMLNQVQEELEAAQVNLATAFDDGVASVGVQECEEVTFQNIPLELPQGWSMLGYTCLESLDVVEAFSVVSDNIEIVKDEWGMVYLPAWGFSAFDNLEFGEGYQIKMLEEVTDFQFCPTISGE